MVGGVGSVWFGRGRTLPQDLWPTANAGFGWADGRFSNSPPAATERAAYERSDLDLTLAGRGSPLTPFPNSLPLHPPLSLFLSGSILFSLLHSVRLGVVVGRREGLMDQT